MNSLFNSALKQTQSIKRDLDNFSAAPVTSSPALQGQISASLASLTRTLDDYEEMARRELIPAKKEKAEDRVKNFRKEMAEFRTHFETLKGERAQAEAVHNHAELLGRRGHTLNSTPENPYANVSSSSSAAAASSPFQRAPHSATLPRGNYSMEEHVFRERDFLQHTDSQLDEFLDRGRQVLADLTDQREILKGTQRRLYGVANTLGISGDTIRMIERRAKQDKWIFYTGAITFFAFCWAVIHYLT
ncbi:putative v-SNARE protein Bos1 [Ascodesmis nigricans]|uniref:Protein transport protein BOS1 n=1 Tax=Ascodesmis nigricans TaxID=341454 RepID=A0A4S2N1S5_9PEZI|nr:putative v-SNARE protein Bos1 [Ascodesmis nigricans]